MDDFICFDDSKERLHAVLRAIRLFTGDVLKLQLKEKVVKIAPVSEGIPFLGFRVFPHLIRLQRPNLVRFRKKLKKKQRLYREGLITEQEVAQSVGSMIAHIKHANSTMMRRSVLKKMAS